METLDKYWEDNAIYYVVFTAKCLSNNNEVIKKFQKFLILDPDVDETKVKQIMQEKLYNLVDILNIDKFEEGIRLKK
ncbi:hypothetical protein CKN82_03460 [Carnobacterium divergens]|uniref:Uncharacterized protein n=1 Tax=Carnobacterium divergens DSM 20623 TaxID=1449336 RepID=A0A0R2HVS0_CARDV|nr:hypothetical protein [Carnobacterium divergens]ANZ98886.1 hypothetical protein BFC22_01695 [Carnobacterium divergens]KRN56800.1 hypothetical protein IV74_GL000809 [Carnobacterium divergens DSM 20623]MDO0875917.1 hypothetical protein [Carnobacterium divergens]MDT1996126.1 hypothetical protein [Carnobacterium divergens]TFI67944.1 hypothetical protein CKN59_02440 [Carnobacterium divergens]